MFYNGYQSASSALEKISGVLEEQPSVPDPVKPVDLWKADGHVRFEEVEFAYTKGRVILPRFDLDIPAGQTIALVGSTGAGKSTLAKLIARFYDPSDGVVSLDGVDLQRPAPEGPAARDRHGHAGGLPVLRGRSPTTSRSASPTRRSTRSCAAAHAVGAHEFIEGLPNGYDTDVNKRGGRVSAGQRQLISFARAFLANPAVLILDEATSSLDIPSERLVQEGLQTLLADRTASSSRTVSRRSRSPTGCSSWSTGASSKTDTPEDLIGGTGRFAALHAAWRDSLV